MDLTLVCGGLHFNSPGSLLAHRGSRHSRHLNTPLQRSDLSNQDGIAKPAGFRLHGTRRIIVVICSQTSDYWRCYTWPFVCSFALRAIQSSSCTLLALSLIVSAQALFNGARDSSPGNEPH
jgi:hypothetical protein